MTDSAQLPTFGGRIVRHVVVSLSVTWLLGTCAALWVAAHFMQQAYDRSLVEDALLVAERVVPVGSGERELSLKLSADELSTVLFDTSEAIFFAVYSASGKFLAGHEGLGGRPPSGGDLPYLSEAGFEGKKVRIATIHRDGPQEFFVSVGQTTAGQDDQLLRLLVATTLPQALLLMALIIGVRRLVVRDLRPLDQLERQVLQRDARDLSPVRVDSDVRDFVRLGESFNSLLSTIRRGVEAQKEFSGNIAHELRTPLSGIRVLAEYGLRSSSVEVMREQLERILVTQGKASRLVDQLLALAFAEELEGSLVTEKVQLDRIVRDALLRFMDRADAAGIDLGAKGLEQPVYVVAQAALVEGMVNNLIDNACRHAFTSERPENPQITVAISVSEAGNGGARRAVLTVSDNGCGLPPGILDGTRKRWNRGDRARLLADGSGLGLSIVAEYARLLDIAFSASPGAKGAGVDLRLEFPLA